MGDSWNVCICMTIEGMKIVFSLNILTQILTIMSNDSNQNVFLLKIVLPYSWRILRLMNKTTPQSTIPTGSGHVVGPYNVSYYLTRTVYWLQNIRFTFQCTSHPSALPIGLFGPITNIKHILSVFTHIQKVKIEYLDSQLKSWITQIECTPICKR